MAEKAKEKSKSTEKIAEKPVEKPITEKRVEKPEKVKKKEKSIYACYKIDEIGLTRLRPFCERCGPGFFMADHGDRYACGHCCFTRYKRT
jgi:small subunit ribosomal protein S27Ae